MKFKLYFLSLVVLLTTTNLFAQTLQQHSCAISGEPQHFSPLNRGALAPVYSGSVDPNLLASYAPISFNIYFWVINKSDGTRENPVPNDAFIKNIQRVNELYKPMGICFVFKGFNYINSDAIYNGFPHFTITNYATNNGYVQQNCFNVYIPKTLQSGNGATSYGSNQITLNEGSLLGMWESVQGTALAHELAHTFNITHVWGSNNSGATTDERVTRNQSDPNYNALTAGDKIHDTAAMTSFWGEIAPGQTIHDILDTENCLYIGTRTDPQGTPFALTPFDVGNPMGYTWDPCVQEFTVGQGIRIREYIDGSPNAQSVQAMVTSSPPLSLVLSSIEINSSFIYWYSNTITTNNTYKTVSGQKINLVAGYQIILEPNTDIVNGSTLIAEIDRYACVSVSPSVTFADRLMSPLDDPTGLSLYPNPNNGTFDIILGKEIKEIVKIEIYDISGKMVYISNEQGSAFTIDAPDLSSGMYIVRISSGDYAETIKFIKQ